jgi:hypothetical protein
MQDFGHLARPPSLGVCFVLRTSCAQGPPRGKRSEVSHTDPMPRQSGDNFLSAKSVPRNLDSYSNGRVGYQSSFACPGRKYSCGGRTNKKITQ